MIEIAWEPNPELPSLRRAIRHQMRRLDRPCAIVAEDFLAAESRIDLLGVGDEGELVSLRIGRRGDDACLLTRAASDLAWLQDRSRDLMKLAPQLGIESSAEPRAILLAPEFALETRRAVETLAPERIGLVRYRSFRHQGQLAVVLESVDSRPAHGLETTATEPIVARSLPSQSPRDADPDTRQAPSVMRPTATSSERTKIAPDLQTSSAGGRMTPTRSAFRTGLTDADLRAEPADLIDVDGSAAG